MTEKKAAKSATITSTGTIPITGGFSKRDRLRKRPEFENLQNSGRKIHTRFFLLSVRENGSERSRLGVTITKRVAPNASDRNKVKRRVREFFRQYRSHLLTPLDMVVIARREAHKCSFKEMTEALLGALRKYGYIAP